MAKFEIKQSDNKEYYYRFKATGNNNIVLRGTQYKTKSACRSDVDAVKANAANNSRYTLRDAVNGEYYFTVKDASGNVVGTSETYTTKAMRDHGISVVKEQAPTASIEDLT